MGDRPTAGVPDEYDLAVGRVEGVDHRDNCVDVITQSDLGAVRVLRLHSGQCERMRAMPRLLQEGTTSSHDEPSSHKPGIKTMSISQRLGQTTDIT